MGELLVKTPPKVAGLVPEFRCGDASVEDASTICYEEIKASLINEKVPIKSLKHYKLQVMK